MIDDYCTAFEWLEAIAFEFKGQQRGLAIQIPSPLASSFNTVKIYMLYNVLLNSACIKLQRP
jgi:hypothetical protein